jgi:hypothetical protein
MTDFFDDTRIVDNAVVSEDSYLQLSRSYQTFEPLDGKVQGLP